MNDLQYQKEMDEALQAARRAADLLNQAEDLVRSAGNWGLWDMLGGGMLSTFMKHSKMDDAQETLTRARDALRTLQKELADVNMMIDTPIEVGDFLRFADYFFDGLIVDWMVQSKIDEAKRQVQEAKSRVTGIIRQLEGRRGSY